MTINIFMHIYIGENAHWDIFWLIFYPKRPPCYALNFHLKGQPLLSVKFSKKKGLYPMLCVKFSPKRSPCYALNFHLKMPPMLSVNFLLKKAPHIMR